MGYEPLTYEDYVYPGWANVLGWAIAGSSVLMIPAVAIYQILAAEGSFPQVFLILKTKQKKKHGPSLHPIIKFCNIEINLQRIKNLTTPWRDHQSTMTRPISMNGIQADPTVIRLTSPQAAHSDDV